MAQLQQIDHFVVLMLENRSFDNLLGYLQYPAETQFDGLSGNEFNIDAGGKRHGVHSATSDPRATWMPDPDPGELHTDINEQIFGNPQASGAATMGVWRSASSWTGPSLRSAVFGSSALPGRSPGAARARKSASPAGWGCCGLAICSC